MSSAYLRDLKSGSPRRTQKEEEAIKWQLQYGECAFVNEKGRGEIAQSILPLFSLLCQNWQSL